VLNECSSIAFHEDEVQTVFSVFCLTHSHLDIEEAFNLEVELLFIFFHFLISISIFFFVFNNDSVLERELFFIDLVLIELFFVNLFLNAESLQGLYKSFEDLNWITDLIWFNRVEELSHREDGPVFIIRNIQLSPSFTKFLNLLILFSFF